MKAKRERLAAWQFRQEIELEAMGQERLRHLLAAGTSIFDFSLDRHGNTSVPLEVFWHLA
jgi:hypothetical protein